MSETLVFPHLLEGRDKMRRGFIGMVVNTTLGAGGSGQHPALPLRPVGSSVGGLALAFASF